jgi:hypothetical protein
LNNSEAHRHACEVRFWFAECAGNPALIKALLERVATKRSAAGVEKLRAGLLEIYKGENGQPEN